MTGNIKREIEMNLFFVALGTNGMNKHS